MIMGFGIINAEFWYEIGSGLQALVTKNQFFGMNDLL
jgi:hypothetical protein